MGLSPAERQHRYKERRYAEIASMAEVACACGCGTMIPPIGRDLKPARYAHGHNPGGEHTRFRPGHEYGAIGVEARKAQGIYSGPGHPAWKGGEYRNKGHIRAVLDSEEAARHPTAIKHSRSNHWTIQRSHIVWNKAHPTDQVQVGDHIHHINGIRDDDRIENLVRLSGSAHIAMHQHANPSPRDPSTGRFKRQRD